MSAASLHSGPVVAGSPELPPPMSFRFDAFSTLLLTVYRLAQALPVQQFQDSALEQLKPFIAFDAASWGTAHMRQPQQGIDFHSIHLHRLPPAMVEAYEKVKHLDEVARAIAREPRLTRAFNARAGLVGPPLQPLLAFRQAFGHDNLLIHSERDGRTQVVQWISLYRRDPEQVYADEEMQVMATAAPHLMQALAMNRQASLERLCGGDARAQWAAAIADVRGVLYHADVRFLQLVADDWPGGEDNQVSPLLMERLRHDSGRVVGARTVVRRTLEHDVLYLKARPRHAVDSLSSSELKVVRLLVTGLTQKEVALTLKRSQDTVRTHVRNIFEKLGIGSAVMLGAILALRD
ncbi:helix-turn-helix transcriptional regulator [Xylophilus sp. Kf1]|nr:helix-turn-helix transcriptional regulator [Xylophilus sp. Kf1]